MNKNMLFLALLCLLPLALAAPTDGQYTLISYSTTASGETTNKDETYNAFISTGETMQSENLADYNFSAAAGFFGEPIQKKIFPEEAAEAVTDVFLIMVPDNDTQNIFLFVFMTIIAMLAILFVWHKKTKSGKEEEVE